MKPTGQEAHQAILESGQIPPGRASKTYQLVTSVECFDRVKRLAKHRNQNVSDLIREALKRYADHIANDATDPDLAEAARSVREGVARELQRGIARPGSPACRPLGATLQKFRRQQLAAQVAGEG